MSIKLTDIFSIQKQMGHYVLTPVRKTGGRIKWMSEAVEAPLDTIEQAIAGDPDRGLMGIEQWIAPPTDLCIPFMGVDRGWDVNRLSGLRFYNEDSDLGSAIYRAYVGAFRGCGVGPDYVLVPLSVARDDTEFWANFEFTSKDIGADVRMVCPNSWVRPIVHCYDTDSVFLISSSTWVIWEAGGMHQLVCDLPGANARIVVR